MYIGTALVLVLGVALVVSLSSGAVTPAGNEDKAGRFQLVQVSYERLIRKNEKVEGEKNNALWILDSATGKTWEYFAHEVTKDGKTSSKDSWLSTTDAQLERGDPFKGSLDFLK